MENLLLNLFLVGLGIWVMIDSYGMGLQALNNPGAGLYPFLLGFLLCLLVLPLALKSLKNLPGQREDKTATPRENGSNFLELGIVLASLLGFYLFLEKLGFVLTSFLFIFGLLWIGNPRKWGTVSIFSLATVGLVFLLFILILKTPFPPGLLR